MCVCALNRSVVSNSFRPHGLSPISLLCPRNFRGKNTGAGCTSYFRRLPGPGISCVGRQILYHYGTGGENAVYVKWKEVLASDFFKQACHQCECWWDIQKSYRICVGLYWYCRLGSISGSVYCLLCLHHQNCHQYHKHPLEGSTRPLRHICSLYFIGTSFTCSLSLVAQLLDNLLAMQETWVRSLG